MWSQCCRVSGMSGSITINGHERNLSQFAKLSAYIMQDNQLHGNLSVDEAMHVATALKLGSDLNKQEKKEVVSQVNSICGFYLTSRGCWFKLPGQNPEQPTPRLLFLPPNKSIHLNCPPSPHL